VTKICAITGRKRAFGNNVSFSKKRTRRDFKPNAHKRTVYVPELGRSVKISLSTRALRRPDKHGGLVPYLRSQGLTLKDVM
jgi:large subunit ribosomal protein L28